MEHQRFAVAMRIVRLAAYIVIVSIPFIVEHVGDTPERDHSPPFLQSVSNFVLGAPLRYQAVTQLGYRKPMPHLVQIVTVSNESLQADPCQRRLFLARLLAKIADAHPSLIVLDSYFGADTCPEGDPGTAAIQKAVTSSKIPVLISLDTFTPWEYRQPGGGSKPKISESEFEKARSGRLVLGRDVSFQTSARANTPGNVMIENTGLVRIAADVRKIPLRFSVHEVLPNGDLGDIRMMRSLGLVAARLYEQEVSNGSVSERLNDLEEEGDFPYITNFLPEKSSNAENGIPITDGWDVVCGKGSKATDWTQCPPDIQGELLSVAPIVVIGQRFGNVDRHESPIGTVYGETLQANYIEALLEERYLTRLSESSTVVLNVAWVLVVELLFFVWPTRRAIAYSVLGTITMLVMTYFVLLQWGFFLVLWTLALAIFSPLLRWLEEVKHLLTHPESTHAGHHPG